MIIMTKNRYLIDTKEFIYDTLYFFYAILCRLYNDNHNVCRLVYES